MNCSEFEYVCKVKKEKNSGCYRLHTVWENEGFSLNVASQNGAWHGQMTEKDMEIMSIQLDVEPMTYRDQCKEALTSHGGQAGMVYSVENGCFVWKKIVDEDSGIKVKMGSVKLEPSNFEKSIQLIADAALNCNEKLQKELKELQKQKQNDIAERKILISKLEEIIHAKDVMETDLYSRFVLLLNSKKKKIKELESIINCHEKSVGNIDEVNIKNFKVEREKIDFKDIKQKEYYQVNKRFFSDGEEGLETNNYLHSNCESHTKTKISEAVHGEEDNLRDKKYKKLKEKESKTYEPIEDKTYLQDIEITDSEMNVQHILSGELLNTTSKETVINDEKSELEVKNNVTSQQSVSNPSKKNMISESSQNDNNSIPSTKEELLAYFFGS